MKSNFLNKLNNVSKAIDKLPLRLAIEAENFSKERFRQQNWIGDTTEPWPKRKPKKNESADRKKRATLTDGGRLRRSVRKISWNSDRIVIGTDVPYAHIHNEGGRYRAKQNVRAHKRDAYMRGRIQVTAHKVGAFQRTINVNMPRRKFIGESPYLMRRLERIIQAEINKALNK